VLDNAPTYLNFLAAAIGKYSMDIGSQQDVAAFSLNYVLDLKAISVAAVFFGAMTYIGNAPNFMVKSIAEQVGIQMPSFIGYVVKYAIPVLLPVLALTWLVFFSGWVL
jgi:Na+/H+ antiporter NhaD/arsenite permease-like protein